MKFMFETSLGMCYGTVDRLGFPKLDMESEILLAKLYDISFHYRHIIENKWLKIRLAKDTENHPEYKIVYID